MPPTAIHDVIIKPLVVHPDERGTFREIIRATDPFFAEGFGQLSISQIHTGVVKAWHWHRQQTDWWYIGCGVIRVGLHDARAESPTYRTTLELLMGDGQPAQVLRIPPGVVHGCKCLQGPAQMIYVTSRIYDPSDELRIAPDDPAIGYDWTK